MKRGTRFQVVAKIKNILSDYKPVYANKFENLSNEDKVLDKYNFTKTISGAKAISGR